MLLATYVFAKTVKCSFMINKIPQTFPTNILKLSENKSGRAADSCGPDLRNLTFREIQNVKSFVISFSKIQDYELSKMVKMQELFVDS